MSDGLPTSCLSERSWIISWSPSGLHVNNLGGRQHKAVKQDTHMGDTKKLTGHLTALCPHMCGMVVLKMSSMQLHVLSQTSEENFSPFRMTTFSRQLVPERASCSLSVGGWVGEKEKEKDVEREVEGEGEREVEKKCVNFANVLMNDS